MSTRDNASHAHDPETYFPTAKHPPAVAWEAAIGCTTVDLRQRRWPRFLKAGHRGAPNFHQFIRRHVKSCYVNARVDGNDAITQMNRECKPAIAANHSL